MLRPVLIECCEQGTGRYDANHQGQRMRQRRNRETGEKRVPEQAFTFDRHASDHCGNADHPCKAAYHGRCNLEAAANQKQL